MTLSLALSIRAYARTHKHLTDEQIGQHWNQPVECVREVLAR